MRQIRKLQNSDLITLESNLERTNTKKVEPSDAIGLSNQITPSSPKAIILTSVKQSARDQPSPDQSNHINSIMAKYDLNLMNNLALIPAGLMVEGNQLQDDNNVAGALRGNGSLTDRGRLVIDTMNSDRKMRKSIDPNDPLNFENVDFFFKKKKKLQQTQRNKQVVKGVKLSATKQSQVNQSNSSQKNQSPQKYQELGSHRSSELDQQYLEEAQQIKLQQLQETISKRPLQGLPVQVQNQEAFDKFFEGFATGQSPPGSIEKDLLLMTGARQYISKRLEGIVTKNQAQEADISELFDIYQKQFNAQRRYKQRWQWWGEAKTSQDKQQTHAVAVQKFDVGTGIQYEDDLMIHTEKRSPRASLETLRGVDMSPNNIPQKIRQLESAKKAAIARVRDGSNQRLADQSPYSSLHRSLNVSGKGLVDPQQQPSGIKRASPLLNESLIRESESAGSLRRGQNRNSSKMVLYQRASPPRKKHTERYVTENPQHIQIQDVTNYDPRESLNYLSLSILTPAQLKGLYDSQGKDHVPIFEDRENLSADGGVDTREKQSPGIRVSDASSKEKMLKSISQTHKDVLNQFSKDLEPVQTYAVNNNSGIKPTQKEQSSNQVINTQQESKPELNQESAGTKEASESPIQPQKPRVSLRRPVQQKSPYGQKSPRVQKSPYGQRSPKAQDSMNQTGATEKPVVTHYSQSRQAQDYTEYTSIQIKNKQLQPGPSYHQIFGQMASPREYTDPNTALLLNEHQSTLPLKRRPTDRDTVEVSHDCESPYFRTKRAAFLPTQIMVQGQPWETGDGSPQKRTLNMDDSIYKQGRIINQDVISNNKNYQNIKGNRNSHISMYQSVDHFISQKYRQQMIATKKKEMKEKRMSNDASKNTGSSQDRKFRMTVSQGSQARADGVEDRQGSVTQSKGDESELSVAKAINVKTLELDQSLQRGYGFFINANELGDLSKLQISIDEPALISKNLPPIGQSQFKVQYQGRNHAKGRYESSLGNYTDHVTQPSTRLGGQFRHSMDYSGNGVLQQPEKHQRRASAAQQEEQRELLQDFLSKSDYQSFGLLNSQLKPSEPEAKQSLKLSLGGNNDKVQTDDSWLPTIQQKGPESRASQIKAYAKDMHKFNYKKWLSGIESRRSSQQSSNKETETQIVSYQYSPESTFRIDNIPYKTKQVSIYGCPKGGSSLSNHRQYVKSVVQSLGCDDSNKKSIIVKSIKQKEQKKEAMAIIEQMSHTSRTDSKRIITQTETRTSFRETKAQLLHVLEQQDEPKNSSIDVDTRLPSNRYLLISQRQNTDLDNIYAELKNHLIHGEENSVTKLERKRKQKLALEKQFLKQQQKIDLSFRQFQKAQGVRYSQTLTYDDPGVFQSKRTNDGETQRTLGKKLTLKHPPLPDQFNRIDLVSQPGIDMIKKEKVNPFKLAAQQNAVSQSLNLKSFKVPRVQLHELQQKHTHEDRTTTTANAPTQSVGVSSKHLSPSQDQGMHLDFKTNLLIQPKTDIVSSLNTQDAAFSSARNFDTSRSGGKSTKKIDYQKNKVKILRAFPLAQKSTDRKRKETDRKVIEIIQKSEKHKKESQRASSQISSQMKIDFNIRSSAFKGARFNGHVADTKRQHKESVQSILLEGQEIEASSVRDFESPVRPTQGSRGERTEQISHDTKAAFFSTKKNYMNQTIPIDDSPLITHAKESYQGQDSAISKQQQQREMNGLDPWLKDVSFMGTIKASGYKRKRNGGDSINPDVKVRIKKGSLIDWPGMRFANQKPEDNYLYRHYMKSKS